MQLLDDKKPQTTNKIRYVTNYVKNWLLVMGNAKFTTSINFIDCMCNAGIYKDGDFCTSVEVLKLFMQSAAIHNNKDFNLYFNDYDEKRIAILQEIINIVYSKHLSNLHIYITNYDVNDYISILLKKKSRFEYSQTTLLFVDPYDFGTVHIPTLRRFCEQYYCELLFNLFTSDWVRNRNNELDRRIDKVIDDQNVHINNKNELVNYIVQQLKVGHMQYGFNYSFHTETNTELYQIMYFTPSEKGLEKLKDALWDTFQGAAYYRNPSRKRACENQLSFFTGEMEEEFAKSNIEYIISCNAEDAKKIILSLQRKKHVPYKDIALPILERTMLKKDHLIKHVFKPMIAEKIIIKLNDGVRQNTYTTDYYDIRG